MGRKCAARRGFRRKQHLCRRLLVRVGEVGCGPRCRQSQAMNSASPSRGLSLPLPVTLHLVDATVVLEAIAGISAEVEALRGEIAAWREGEGQRGSAMLSAAQIAELLQVNRRTVARWVLEGLFPHGVRFGMGGSSGRRWKRTEVEAWIAQHSRTP